MSFALGFTKCFLKCWRLNPFIGHSSHFAFSLRFLCSWRTAKDKNVFDWEMGVKFGVWMEDTIYLVERMKILDSLTSTLKLTSSHSFLFPLLPPLSLLLSHLISDAPWSSYILYLYKFFLFTFYKKWYIRPNQNKIILNGIFLLFSLFSYSGFLFFYDYEWLYIEEVFWRH